MSDANWEELKAQLVAERRRREEAEAEASRLRERERHFAKVLGVADGGQYRADWDGAIQRLVARAEQAERERDAARESFNRLRSAIDAEPSRAEKIHTALVAAGIPEEDEVSGVIGLEEHVGRALERMRALEKVRDLVTKVAVVERRPTEEKQAVWREMWDACAAYDALKVPHE